MFRNYNSSVCLHTELRVSTLVLFINLCYHWKTISISVLLEMVIAKDH